MKFLQKLRFVKTAFIALIVLSSVTLETAQAETPRRLKEEPEVETKDTFSAEVQGGVGGLIGSVDSTAFSLGGSTVFRGAQWRQTFSASSLLTTVDTPHGQYGRELKASYRFRFLWLPRFSNFIGTGVSQQTTSGEDRAIGGDIGGSFHFFPNHPRNVRLDLGYSPSYSKSTLDEVSHGHSIFTALFWEEPFPKNWKLSQSLFADVNAQEAANYSFENVETIAYNVTANVAIHLSLTTTYDRQPTTGFKRLNFLVMPACSFAF